MKELVMLHGALGSTTLFQPLITALKDQYKVHSFNFSGHGGEEFNQAGFGIEYFAEELDHFLVSQQLTNLPVFGYSMGGYVALYLESIKPGSFSQIVTLGTKFGWQPDSAVKEASMLVPEVISEKVPRFAEALAKRHGLQWEALVRATAKMMIGLGDKPLLAAESLSNISLPVTIMLGDQDNMVSKEESEEAATSIKAARFIQLPETPHPIEKVNPQFLSQVLSSLIS